MGVAFFSVSAKNAPSSIASGIIAPTRRVRAPIDRSAAWLPRVYCAILRTVVLNAMHLRLDRVFVDVGPGKCEGARYLADVLEEMLGVPVLRTENRDAEGFGFPLCQAALPPAEIRLFLRQFLGSGRSFACMESMPGHIPTNPGAFRLTEDSCGKLMKLAGDHGAMKIIKAAPWDAYYYQIGEEDVRDIDEREG